MKSQGDTNTVPIPDGFLCIDKPPGATSRDVVNRIQRLVRPVKVGHAGTLDPLATGVLVLALGRATRLISYVQRMPKRYEGTFELGKTSDTEDITGQVESQVVELWPTDEQVDAACALYVGQIMQRPPAYSALKVNGRRAYDLARAGQDVKLAPRSIAVHSIGVRGYAFPTLELDVLCGSGTYIRSLGRDIGETLQCGAVMSQLRRTSIGGFRIQEAAPVTQFSTAQDVRDQLLPVAVGIADLDVLTVSAEQGQAIAYGQKIQLDGQPNELAAVDQQGTLLAVLLESEPGCYRPGINFAAK